MVEAAGEVVFATAESTTCESSSSPTPGILRSMASFARSIL